MRLLLLLLLLPVDRVAPISLFVTVGVVVFWLGKRNTVFFWALLIGLMHDVLWIRQLGYMSIFLIVLALLVGLLSVRFERGVWLLVMLTGLLAEIGYRFYLGLPWSLSLAFGQAFVTLVLWFLVGWGKQDEEVYLKS